MDRFVIVVGVLLLFLIGCLHVWRALGGFSQHSEGMFQECEPVCGDMGMRVANVSESDGDVVCACAP